MFAIVESRGRGGHDVRDAGAAGEVTGASREWRFGDEQPLDVVRTVRNAVLRTRRTATVRLAGRGLRGRRDRAALRRPPIALLVDMSYSMELRGTWGEAKTTALALHSLVTTKYPQDAIEIIGFSDYARVMSPNALVEHDWDRVQGTNLQHGLMLARRHLDKHRGAEPVILVITDGEPTAHLAPDGFADFAWPPTRETIAATLAEVERCTRRGATINVFMLDDDPRLVAFMQELGRRNGGRVFQPKRGALGEFVVADYLASRRRRRAASAVPAERRTPSRRRIAGRGLFATAAHHRRRDRARPSIAEPHAVDDLGLLNHSCDPNLGWSRRARPRRDARHRRRRGTDRRLRHLHRRPGLRPVLPLRDLPLPAGRSRAPTGRSRSSSSATPDYWAPAVQRRDRRRPAR